MRYGRVMEKENGAVNFCTLLTVLILKIIDE